jgi:hypothetical protein
MEEAMKKKKEEPKKTNIEEIIELYEKYKELKGISGFIPKKRLPPLTLDERLESINQFYVRSGK